MKGLEIPQAADEAIITLQKSKAYYLKKISYPQRPGVDVRIDRFIRYRVITHPTWGEVKIEDQDTKVVYENPSINRLIHSWLFINDFYEELTRNENRLVGIGDFILQWSQDNLHTDKGSKLFTIIYHDETTAQRMNQALRLHIIFRDKGHQKVSAALEELMTVTAEILSDENFYAGNNNHGMFQAKALRDYASYAIWEGTDRRIKYLERSNKWITSYFMCCFTSEGVHIEHSPSYHLLVSKHVSEQIDFVKNVFGQAPKDLERILDKATQHALHSIQPDRRFLPLSDTVQNRFIGSQNNIYDSPEFSYVTSGGNHGIAPLSRTLSEPISGYTFHRTSWDNPLAGYLAFIAAYNGGYHKHSDDLHLYLFKNGIELLTESGPYGYGMNNPLVRLGFSQFAHNNIIVDSRSLPRHDGRSLAVSMTPIREMAGKYFAVSGTNSRFDNLRHDREVIFDDFLKEIVVTDALRSTQHHKYSLIWNFGHAVDIEISDQSVLGTFDGEPLIRLTFEGPEIDDIICINGREGKNPSAWRFPSFGNQIAINQVSVNFSGIDSEITTRIEIYDPPSSTIDALKKIQNKSSRSQAKRSSKITKANTQPNSDFANIYATGRTIKIISSEPSVRGVVRLYNGQVLIGEEKGVLRNISWNNLTTGNYRARIYPKGNHTSIPAYTTGWLHIG